MKANQQILPLSRPPARRRSTLKALMTSAAFIAAGVGAPRAQTWSVEANGAWETPGNWNPASVPNSFNANATLGPAITADRTITLSTPILLNTLNFQGANSYTLAPASGSGALTFDGGFSANLNSAATASQTIGSNVALNKYLNANIGAGGDVAITGDVSGVGGITKTGAGALILSGADSYAGFTNVNAGVLRAGADNAFSPSSLTTVAAGATLDLNGFNQAVGSLSGAGTVTLGSANLTINGGNYKFSGQISGDGGSLTKAGSGTTWLTGTNTYTGGTTVSSGTLQVGDVSQGGSILGNATINSGATLLLFCNTAGMGGSCNGSTGGSGTFSGTIVNNGTLGTPGGGTLTFSGEISGSGKLVPTQGLVVLTANNSYTGGTDFSNGGTLQVGNGGTTGTMGTGEVSVPQLTFNRSNEMIVDNLLTGTGAVTQAGAGKVIFTANNNYTGVTTVNSGTTLQIGNGGESGALGDGVQHDINGTLIFNRSNAYSVNDWLFNDGAIINAGTGTTTLNGGVVGAGSVSTTAGKLILNSSLNDFSGGASIGAGSTLEVGGDSNPGSGNIKNDGELILNKTTFGNYAGAISGAGVVRQSGVDAFILDGNNTYSGGTIIDSSRELRVSASGTLGSGSVQNGGMLRFSAGSSLQTQTIPNAITGPGSIDKRDAGTTVLTADNSFTGGTSLFQGKLQLGNGGTTGGIANTASVDLQYRPAFGYTILSFNRSDRVVFDAPIMGGGIVAQDGAGTTVLTKDNTYTGGTMISAGTLQVGDGGTTGALGSGPVTNDAKLILNRSNAYGFDGAIANSGVVTQAGAGATTLGGTISGAGAVSTTAGSLILTANNTYTGGTTIAAGTLQLGNGGTTGMIAGNVSTGADGVLAFRRSNNLTFGGLISGEGKVIQDSANPGAILEMTADNTYSGGTEIKAGTLYVGTVGARGSMTGALGSGPVINDAKLTFNRRNAYSFDGAIANNGVINKEGDGTTTLGGGISSAGSMSLRAGKLILTADNSYTGPTTIDYRTTLQLGNGGAAGTLGSGPVVDNGVLAIDRSGVFEISGVISGYGSLQKKGSGAVIMSADNTYSGGTTIEGGTLQLGNGGTTGSIVGDLTNRGALSFNRSNTLVFDGLIKGGGIVTQDGPGRTVLTANNEYFGDTIITAGTLQLGNGGTTGFINSDVINYGTLSFNHTGDNSSWVNNFWGAISGTGKVTQDGANTTRLIGDNTYTGGTIINAGRLQLGDGGETGSIIGDVVNNAELSFNRSNTLTLDGKISGTGRVLQEGAGTTVLTADNSYSGGTLISAGTLQIGNGGASGTLGSGPVVDNSVLAINRSGSFEIPGVISGTGRLDQMGPGTTILTGNNTYTGGTTISGGALQLGNGGTTGWIIGDVANDGTLIFNRSDAVTFDPTISGTGGVIQMGSGSTNLTAANTYTGPTLVQAGKLSINGSITSDTTVLPGATLGGNGAIFGNVMNFGTVAPGNSIGRLNIVGSYTQAAGSFYQVELNPAGQADRIMVSGAQGATTGAATGVPGTATINGGTVQVLAANGIYPLTYKYTIVTATGGVTGKYAGLTTNYAFLRPTITYDANNVYLEASVNTPTTVDFTCGASTANQNAVATALNQVDSSATGDFANVIGALFGLNNNQGSAALDAMSGQPYSGFGNANVFSANLFGSGLRQQMALGRHGSADGSRTAIRTADGRPSRLSTWASGIGGTSNGAGRVCGGWAPGRTAGQVFNAAGVMGGVDYRIDPSLMVGLGGGWAGGNNWTRGFSGRGESDSLMMATYASYTSGAAYADLMAGYAWNTNRMSRQIAIPGLPGERTARGSTGAPQWYGQAEFGYRLDLGGTLMSNLTPFARLEATTIAQRAFTEWGAAGLDLAVASQRTSSLRSVLGAEFTTAYNPGWKWPLGLQARAGYAHDYANMTRPVTAGFAAVPWSRFTVQGAAPPRDSATVGLRLWALLDERYWPFLRYDGDIARGANSHALNAGLRVSW